MPISYDDNEAVMVPDENLEALLTETTGPVNAPLPPSPAPFDANQALEKLLSSLQDFRNAGLIQQRADGSFVLPGQKDRLWEERLAIGSTCTCPACTEHNQRHWLCMVCGTSHEWVLVQDRPRTMKTQLSTGGRTGYQHLVDSNECALEYRRRMGLGEGVAQIPGQERPIPVAGGDDDPLHFFSDR